MFKVGDWIRLKSQLPRGERLHAQAGAQATVMMGDHYPAWAGGLAAIKVEWDRSDFRSGVQSNGGYCADCFELIGVPLDWTKPVRTRAGWKVDSVEYDSAGDVYRARIHMSDQSRILTFNSYGHFYPGIEQPIDLVNT